MRIKTLAITALALLGLAVPASAGAKTTLIGSGSVAAQPVLQALFKTYETQVNKNVNFLYTPDGGNAGVKDVQNGTSQFAGQARTPLPSDAGTTYIKLYLDGLCLDVNKANKLSNISIQQTHDIYRGLLTNWTQVPGSGPDDHDRPGRPRHQWRYVQLLPPGRPQQRTAGVQRQRADRRRPRRQRGQAGPERDRLRRSRLAEQQEAEGAEGQRHPLPGQQDQRRAAQVPAVAVHLHRPADGQPVARRCRNSSTGRAPARWPAKSITKAGGVPAFNKKK